MQKRNTPGELRIPLCGILHEYLSELYPAAGDSVKAAAPRYPIHRRAASGRAEASPRTTVQGGSDSRKARP